MGSAESTAQGCAAGKHLPRTHTPPLAVARLCRLLAVLVCGYVFLHKAQHCARHSVLLWTADPGEHQHLKPECPASDKTAATTEQLCER